MCLLYKLTWQGDATLSRPPSGKKGMQRGNLPLAVMVVSDSTHLARFALSKTMSKQRLILCSPQIAEQD